MNVHRHYPGCGHDTTQPPDEPPNPGGTKPTSSIGMYTPILLLLAFMLIVYLKKWKKQI